jgi:hypothetical protein
VGFVIDASIVNPASLYSGNGGNLVEVARLTERVRVYWPRVDQQALVFVQVLTGAKTGTMGRVARNRVINDQKIYVSSELELSTLMTTMAMEWFLDSKNVAKQIPFLYPTDGCPARAHVMAELLKASRYVVDKVFLIYNLGLRVPTVYGNDLVDLSDSAAVTWWYHVAPVVYLSDNMHRWVIDPSVSSKPQTPDDWSAIMTAQVANQMSYDDMVARLLVNKSYPTSPLDRPWMVFAASSVWAPPAADKPNVPEKVTPDEIAQILEFATLRVPQRVAVGALNTLMNNWRTAVDADNSKRNAQVPYPQYQTDLNSARNKFIGLSMWDRQQVKGGFKNLLTDCRATSVGSGIEDDIKRLLIILDLNMGIQ